MSDNVGMEPRVFGAYRRSTTVDDAAGVHAGQRPDEGYANVPYDVARGEWALWLPHDCDEWIIAQGTREEVIVKGREFVASLVEALDAMEADGE